MPVPDEIIKTRLFGGNYTEVELGFKGECDDYMWYFRLNFVRGGLGDNRLERQKAFEK